MKHFLLYGHGGSYNHGAEAIVRTTIQMIRNKYPDAYIGLSSHFPEQDKEFGIDADEIIGPNTAAWTAEKAAPPEQKETLARTMYAQALDAITQDTTLLSVGGDIFCYPNWHRLTVFQREAERKKAKSILWGCSVEPSAITPDMLEVLRSYTHIVARESLTYNALCQYGLTDKLVLALDPAFMLQPAPFPLPEGIASNHVVGINISPLAIRRESKSGILLDNIRLLIDFIVSQTDMNIALIPHVMMPMDNDYTVLAELEQSLPSDFRSRVWLAGEKHSAAELKSLISKCNFLVCSRTHASIAAYSSCVPTLVIGYSVKSKGIAQDMGLDEFVLDLSTITDDHALTDIFKWLYAKENEVKSILNENLLKITDKTHNLFVVNF